PPRPPPRAALVPYTTLFRSASGACPRTSLGYAGAKYEMGLEHIEQVEVVTAELAARVFNASFAEVRVPSGAMANLFAFMATSRRSEEHTSELQSRFDLVCRL